MPIAKEAWFYPLISPKDLEVVRTDFFRNMLLREGSRNKEGERAKREEKTD